MADINTWSRTAADNNQSVPDGAPEGWLGADVNAWARETMAALRTGWESDEWRNITVDTAGSGLTISRDSSTQLTITSGDFADELFVGARVRVSNASSSVTGTVTSATLSGSDTIVVVDVDQGLDADGTSGLTTGNISFDTNVITRSSGSWVTDGLVAGDRLKISGHADNDGVYAVSNVAALTMTLTPVDNADYSVIDATTPGAGTCYRISDVSPLPSAPLVSVEVAGAHTDQFRVQDYTGTGPLNLVTHEDLGDAAYQREDDLYVGRAVLADTATAVADAARKDLVHIQRLSSSFTYNDGVDGASKVVPDFENCPFPGTPDGSKEYMVRVVANGYQGGVDAGGFAGFALFVGPSGSTVRDSGRKQGTGFTGSGSNFHLAEVFFVTPATGDVWTIKAEGSPGAGVDWAWQADSGVGSDSTTLRHAGWSTYVEVIEVTRDAT